MGYCFVHAADLHLDTPFTRIGPVPPSLQPLLRDASLAAFDRLIDLALRRDAAFVLLAGGIYDGPDRGLRAQVRLRDGLERLRRHGIPTIILLEGSSHPDDWLSIGSWPDGVTCLAPGMTQTVPVERDGRRLATIARVTQGDLNGVPRPTVDPYQAERSGLRITLLHTQRDGDHASDPHGGVLHQHRGVDYWALGGRHDAHIVSSGTGPLAVYPGTLQGRSLTPDELGPKGAMVVPVEEGMTGAPEFVSLAPVQLLRLRIDQSEIADLAELRSTLQERAAALRAEHRVDGLLLQAELVGQGPLHGELLQPGTLEGLLRQLRASVDPAPPIVWWAQVRLHPGSQPVGALAGHDFAADLRRLAAELVDDPERLRSFAAEHLDALQRLGPYAGSGAPDRRELADRLALAEALALHLLAGRGRA